MGLFDRLLRPKEASKKESISRPSTVIKRESTNRPTPSREARTISPPKVSLKVTDTTALERKRVAESISEYHQMPLQITV